MKKDWREIIAIGNYHYTAYSFDYFLESVSSLGVKNIEIWGAKPHLCVNSIRLNDVEAFREKIDKKGLRVICFCPEQNTYPLDIAARDDDFRDYSIEQMKKAIRITHMLGSDRMLLCPGNGSLDESFEEIKSRFRNSVMELTETAQSYGVILCLETQAQEDSLFMNTVEQQKEAVREIDSDYFKAMIDTVQTAQFDSSVRHSIEVLGIENLKHIHLGNTIVREKTFYEKCAPQKEWDSRMRVMGRNVCGHIGFREGNLSLGKNITDLFNMGYEGYVTIEICQRPYFFEAHRYAKEALEYTIDVIKSM